MAKKESEFTPIQVALLEELWDTQTEVKVGRRFENPNKTYCFEHINRPTRPIDFAQEGEFVLKLHEKKPAAPLSPYYINLRNLPETLLTKVGLAMAEATSKVKMDIDMVSGIPAAGDPIAQKYSEITDIHLSQLFGKAEGSSGRKITAVNAAPRAFGRWGRVLIVDDLITEADTKFEAAEVAGQLGYKVAGITVLVDRQQGGREQLQAAGYKIFAPLPVSKVFEYYYTTGRIDRGLYESSMNYLNSSRAINGLPRLELLAA